MTARQLLFRDDARDKIRRGVDALAEAVKVTLGPRGRTVILDRDHGPPQIVNSGVLVAWSVELENRFENMGAQLLREVASRSSEMAGDGTTQAIQERVASIRKEREAASSDYDKEKLEERISRLSGGVALIKVGAATETELKERKIRVEDALHATHAAIEEGIVPGGGVALLRARRVLASLHGSTLDHDSGIRMIANAPTPRNRPEPGLPGTALPDL